MGYETYYYALRLSGGDVLRVAQDAETVWSIYDATIPAIVLSCVAVSYTHLWQAAHIQHKIGLRRQTKLEPEGHDGEPHGIFCPAVFRKRSQMRSLFWEVESRPVLMV